MAVLVIVQKRKIPASTGNQTLVVQHVASHWFPNCSTDYVPKSVVSVNLKCNFLSELQIQKLVQTQAI
jgi:hypothetical protein